MSRITYKKSGVDISKANAFVRGIKRDVQGTLKSAVLRREGAFGGLFALPVGGFKNPVLVSSTDGVGTKLLIAQMLGRHDTVGIDLVAMNINDILCVGAKPLFFLDYIACGRLRPQVLRDVVKGIAKGCRISGCSLIGGETAEMPGLYGPDEYDLAGFAVGVVEQSKIIDGRAISKGDRVLGLPSAGVHSNGFSLIRAVLSKKEQVKYKEALLTPTRIYAREIGLLTEKFRCKGIAHITGGAFYEKLTKILPRGKCFVIDTSRWPVPEIFQIIQEKGKIQKREMYRTFNMGIGLAVVVSARDVSRITVYLKKRRLKHYWLGTVTNDSKRRIVL